MAETLRPDICVIGGGPGGLSVAAAAAAFGVPTVLIEAHKMGGGYLDSGCVPSKALVAAARRAEMTRNAKMFGVDVRDIRVNFSDIHRRIHSLIASATTHVGSIHSPPATPLNAARIVDNPRSKCASSSSSIAFRSSPIASFRKSWWFSA